MAKVENDLDIYYAVGNANTKRQENELAAIMKIRNFAEWKLILTSFQQKKFKTSFQIFFYFEKRNDNQYWR